MSRMTQVLDILMADADRPRIPIRWSAGRIQALRDMANKTAPLRSPIDDQVAAAVLLAIEGRFVEAEAEAVRLLREHTDLVRRDNETFISVMFALYAVQQFGLLAVMLHDRFGYNAEFSIGVEENGPDIGRVRWDISPEGVHRFVFDAKSYWHDETREDILVLFWSFPLYSTFSFSHYRERGSIIVNQVDIGHTPGLAWCDNRPQYFLVPDCMFTPTRGYKHVRDHISNNFIPWDDRKDVAFWRGSTTGIPKKAGDPRSIERVELCEIAKRFEHLGFLDIGLSSVVQISDPDATEALRNSGLLRDYVPWERWSEFKYLIDIDGNSSAWSGLFQRLLTGSTVLKVESFRGFRQWYYDELTPWVNYIPIASDMSDLVDKLRWLQDHQHVAKAIGEAGRALAMSLTYERELGRAVHTIARCFRYFRGEAVSYGPFGREWPNRGVPGPIKAPHDSGVAGPETADVPLAGSPSKSDAVGQVAGDGRCLGAGQVRRKLAVVGDSYQGQNFNFINANGRNFTLNGSVTFLNVLVRQAFCIDIDNGFFIQGASGTEFILSQIPAIVSYQPDFLVFCAGHNDIIQGVELATIQGNFVRIINALKEAGIVPIMCLTGPQNSVQGSKFVTLDKARELIVSLNRWKRDFASRHEILLWDWYTPMVDPVSGGYASGMTSDDIHPGFKAAYLVARQGLTDLASIIPPPTTALQSEAADGGNLVADAFFKNVGADIATPVTGVGPSGWSVRRSNGAAVGGSIVNSLIPAEDGLGTWNRLAVSGITTEGTRSEEVGFFTAIYAGPETYGAGDVLEAWLEISVAANSPFNGVLFSIGDHNGDTLQRQATNGGHAGGINETTGPAEAWSGVLYCPRLTISTPSESGRPFLLVQIIVRWDASKNDFSGVIEFRRPTVRKATGWPGFGGETRERIAMIVPGEYDLNYREWDMTHER